jgi:uncharacterized protein YndB with AHSA1/START domain
MNVWEVMTNPEKIKMYLYGTETITDWKVGSTIVFQGAYEGATYKDKGNVLENKTGSKLKYNYWSGFSGLPDEPDNYSIITYDIEKVGDSVVMLSWTQEGFATIEGHQHMEKGLMAMLEKIKDIAENGK